MRRERSALAALEFALVAPLLSALLIGSVDAAQLFLAQLRLSAAVHAGADYALANQSSVSAANGAALAAAIAQIVGNINGVGWASGTVVVNNGPTVTFSNGSAVSGGSASSANAYYCLSGSPGAWEWGTSVSDDSEACDNAGDGAKAGKFVTITASRAFTPSILSVEFASGPLTQSVAVQVQ
ncbi:MAG TPA: pilus assembly protein [Rhodopila sp.]|nr:pilus assembly protein [Rhodopila sp.]